MNFLKLCCCVFNLNSPSSSPGSSWAESAPQSSEDRSESQTLILTHWFWQNTGEQLCRLCSTWSMKDRHVQVREDCWFERECRKIFSLTFMFLFTRFSLKTLQPGLRSISVIGCTRNGIDTSFCSIAQHYVMQRRRPRGVTHCRYEPTNQRARFLSAISSQSRTKYPCAVN